MGTSIQLDFLLFVVFGFVIVLVILLCCCGSRSSSEDARAPGDDTDERVEVDAGLALEALEAVSDGSEGACMVCRQPIKEGEPILVCLHCAGVAHKAHMVEWIQEKGSCPMCRRALL